jgi:glutamine cyclotransferase
VRDASASLRLWTLTLAAVAATCGCGSCEPKPAGEGGAHPADPAAAPAAAPAVSLGSLEHDRSAFTEGLAFWQGHLFEGTGNYGESALRELDPATGRELRHLALDPKYFGEGITILGGRLYELTWKEQVCFVYDPDSFTKLTEITYEGEGWGLTNDGKSLIMSNGSEWIHYRDPATLKIQRSIKVTMAGQPVQYVNELEYVRGEIWANVWHSDTILRISPADGHVIATLDAEQSLHAAIHSNDPDDVLNGIAFDDASGTLLVTGKRWPMMFKVQLPK